MRGLPSILSLFRNEFNLQYRYNMGKNGQLGENCIQHFHLGRYIIGYAVGSLVLR